MGTMSLLAADAATSGCAITAEMLKPLVDAISANIAVIIPVGVVIMGFMYGPKLLPSILKKFAK